MGFKNRREGKFKTADILRFDDVVTAEVNI